MSRNAFLAETNGADHGFTHTGVVKQRNLAGIAVTGRTTPKSIDEYISAFSPEVRSILTKMRLTISKAAPGAKEMISYRIPAFVQNGILVYFAAFKRYIGLYPPVKGDARLVKAVSKYAGEKGNLRFPLDQPIPYSWIERIVRFRIKQDTAKAAGKKKRT